MKKLLKKTFVLFQHLNCPLKRLKNPKLHYRATLGEIDDPLFIWKQYQTDKIFFTQWLDEIKKEKKFKPNPYTIGRFIYHMGNHGVYNDYILDMIDNSYELFKNKFKIRSAYGFFIGSLKLNLGKNLIYFSRKEYERFGVGKNYSFS